MKCKCFSVIAAWVCVVVSLPSFAEPHNSYGYTAREPDASGLIYYRNRYYDPLVGRFTQRDPIGLRGGVNDYAYVGGNPANLTDAFGLQLRAPFGLQATPGPPMPAREAMAGLIYGALKIGMPEIPIERFVVRECLICFGLGGKFDDVAPRSFLDFDARAVVIDETPTLLVNSLVYLREPWSGEPADGKSWPTASYDVTKAITKRFTPNAVDYGNGLIGSLRRYYYEKSPWAPDEGHNNPYILDYATALVHGQRAKDLAHEFTRIYAQGVRDSREDDDSGVIREIRWEKAVPLFEYTNPRQWGGRSSSIGPSTP